MSFDARSLERLQQLGRSLPQPLPRPDPAQPEPGVAQAAASGRRHKVETETDPEALFRELMQVSPDGSVPPHLMDRLRQAEQEQQRRRRERQQRELQHRLQANRPAGGVSSSSGATGGRRSNAATSPAGSSPLKRLGSARGEGSRALDSATQELYVAFQHLLLEDDSED
jgi:hypothetical protein